ncbi:uncharacterized protein METZ01_LOCUS414915, partial [marine metagenome]
RNPRANMADGQHGLVGRDTTGDDPASVLLLSI